MREGIYFGTSHERIIFIRNISILNENFGDSSERFVFLGGGGIQYLTITLFYLYDVCKLIIYSTSKYEKISM